MGNILIVEDDPSIRKLVRVNLVKRGYTVSEAEDSHQAIALFQEVPVDLVLLDLMLPGLSGVDVCTWIRARSDVPIIVLSARLEEDLKVAALDAGADDYVTKPFGSGRITGAGARFPAPVLCLSENQRYKNSDRRTVHRPGSTPRLCRGERSAPYPHRVCHSCRAGAPPGRHRYP